jgi:predicted PolB exonuclease-like 3'-5' exonuclease
MNITESKLKSCLFFDIETCGNYSSYQEFQKADPEGAHIWEKKSHRMSYGSPEEGYTNKVSLFPEFGRIVCLSYGVWKNGEIAVNTIIDPNENVMIKYIANLFHKAGSNGLVPTGWNIKNFDIPWVQRKLAMHGLMVPNSISTFEKKPWDVNIFDMKEMWKSFSNLDVTFEEAAYVMGIPTPKDDIDGSQVHEEFWKGNTERIQTYCEKDVKTMILMMEKLYTINNPKIHA